MIFSNVHQLFYVLSVFYLYSACHTAVCHCLIKRILYIYDDDDDDDDPMILGQIYVDRSDIKGSGPRRCR